MSRPGAGGFWMLEAATISRTTSLTKLRYGEDELSLASACTVRLNTPIRDVVERACEGPFVLVISVVDERDRLVGLIPIDVLLKSLLVRVAPEAFVGFGTDHRKAVELARLILARTAEDLMQQPAFISASAPECVAGMLRQMIGRGLLALPVIDDEGRVLGEVEMLRLILLVLREGRREEMPSSADSRDDW